MAQTIALTCTADQHPGERTTTIRSARPGGFAWQPLRLPSGRSLRCVLSASGAPALVRAPPEHDLVEEAGVFLDRKGLLLVSEGAEEEWPAPAEGPAAPEEGPVLEYVCEHCILSGFVGCARPSAGQQALWQWESALRSRREARQEAAREKAGYSDRL